RPAVSSLQLELQVRDEDVLVAQVDLVHHVDVPDLQDSGLHRLHDIAGQGHFHDDRRVRTTRDLHFALPRADRLDEDEVGAHRVAIDRMNTPESTPVSAIRIRSPRTAPPVYGDVGSTATTPTVLPRDRKARTNRLIKELFPTPGGPVNPTTWARPVCGKIRATASTASGSSSSMSEISLPADRLSPLMRESTRPPTESREAFAGMPLTHLCPPSRRT